MDYVNLPVTDFSDALASKAPVPGGGGASALVASLGAALGVMVGDLTVGKKRYEANEKELLELMAESQRIRTRLLELVDEDARVFVPLSEAYAIPKDDPERAEIMEKCLTDAAAVPMEILELSCRVIQLQQGFARLGSSLAVSDAGTGVVFAWSAMYGAALNVLVNTKGMRDTERRDALNARVKALMEENWVLADRVYEQVYQGLLPD